MKLKIKFFLFFVFACCGLFPVILFADAATVTNTGNVPVRVQYKTGNSDYQDQTLKPGESKELPGGVEKVKVSREQPGEWASPLKPGQEVQVTVKEGNKPVGTLKGFGDKLIFDHPTAAPPTTAVQIGSQPAQTQKAQEPAKPQPAKEPATSKTQPSKSEPVKPVEGKVTNDGNSTVIVSFKKTDGTTTSGVPVRAFNSITMPEDATNVILSKPMIESGIRWPERKDTDVKITQPDGTTTTVNDVPAAYTRETKNIKVARPYDNLKIDYFQGSPFKTSPYRDMLKTNYQYNSSDQPNARDTDTSDIQRQRVQYKF